LQALGGDDTLDPMNSSELFRQFLDAGMQFTQLTQRRAEAIVKDLVKTGEIQAEQAQATVAEFVDRSRANTEKLFEQIRAEIRQQLKVLGVATKADLAKVGKQAAATAGAGSTATKAPAKKTAARKSTAKKTTARKSTAKKTTARKSTARKSTAKKSMAKRTAAKKSSASEAPFTRTPSADAS
jgi:polyhydroxyalkanoate synthesis regulator phasin